MSRSLEVEPRNGGGEVRGDPFYLLPCIWGSAECLEYLRHTPRHMLAHSRTHTHTHTAWAPLQFARNDLSCVIYTRLPPVKGWMCSFNFFLFSIGFIYFLSALLLCLLRQSAFFLPSPFLCSHPVSENTITLAAPAAADADALNSISPCCCNVREGGGGTGTAR